MRPLTIESSLPVAPTTELLDTTEVTQADGTVTHREGVFIGDPDKAGHRANVTAHTFGISDQYSVLISGPELQNLCDLMSTLITEQRLANVYLSRLTGEELTTDDLEEQHGLT